MEDMKYIIADNVRAYRKRENLTQMELAERAQLSIDSIKRIEGQFSAGSRCAPCFTIMSAVRGNGKNTGNRMD